MKKTFKRHLITALLSFALVFFFFKGNASFAEDVAKVQITFYDSDRSTIIAGPFETVKDTKGATINSGALFSSDYDYGLTLRDICRIKNGYALKCWDSEYRKNSTDNYIPYKTGVNPVKFSLGNTDTFKINKFDYNMYAVYSDEPVDFPIKYVLNGGSLSGTIPKSANVTADVSLPTPYRKGCEFQGWYLDSRFSAEYKVTKISKDYCMGLDYADDSCTEFESITLYAKWKNLTPATPTISSLTNPSSGKVSISLKKPSANPVAYELTYASDKKFTKNVQTIEFKPADKMAVTGLTKDKTYYFKVRAYNLDSKKVKTYSSYSSVKSIKITKGTTEVKPTSTSVKIKSIKVLGASTKSVQVTTTLSKRLKSYDDFYYLVRVDQKTGKYLSVVGKTAKVKNPVFTVPFRASSGINLYASKLAIAVQSSKDKYMLVSKSGSIENLTAAAKYTKKYPTPTSKKGRQGVYSQADGDKNYFFNVDLNSVITTKGYGEAFKYNGKTYYFKSPNTAMDETIKFVNADGGTVTLQVMLSYNEKNKSLIKSTARSDRSKHYYAFNVEDTASRYKIEAAFFWLAQRYSTSSMHVDNWILGNEVNTFKNPIGWHWAGNISNDEFIKNYADTFRILYYAVASNNKYGRVFTCVDHTFNNRGYEWGSKDFLVAFNDALKKLDSKVKWNLAYHAYSSVLTNADFWNDNKTPSLYTTDNTYTTDFVSPLNIEVMVQYVREKFGKNVHIILSEQAFSSTAGTNSAVNGGRAYGEDVQAAAIAYLYYKVMFNNDIDAVIYSHPFDDLGAGQDFKMKDKAKSVYKYMDTPSYGTYTTSCLGTISRSGQKATSWKSLVPSFDDSALRKMPSR